MCRCDPEKSRHLEQCLAALIMERTLTSRTLPPADDAQREVILESGMGKKRYLHVLETKNKILFHLNSCDDAAKPSGDISALNEDSAGSLCRGLGLVKSRVG